MKSLATPSTVADKVGPCQRTAHQALMAHERCQGWFFLVLSSRVLFVFY